MPVSLHIFSSTPQAQIHIKCYDHDHMTKWHNNNSPWKLKKKKISHASCLVPSDESPLKKSKSFTSLAKASSQPPPKNQHACLNISHHQWMNSKDHQLLHNKPMQNPRGARSQKSLPLTELLRLHLHCNLHWCFLLSLLWLKCCHLTNIQ